MSGNGSNFFKLLASKAVPLSGVYNLDLDLGTVYNNVKLQIGVQYGNLSAGAGMTLSVFNGYGNDDPNSTIGAVPYVDGGSNIPTFSSAGTSKTLTANLATPAAPALSTSGTAGTTSYSYVVVAKNANGNSNASTVGTIATGNATLNTSNFNVLTITPVTGATSYDIYRTASAGTPATLGKIASTATTTFNDKGTAGDGSTAPTVGSIVWTDLLIHSSPYDDQIPKWQRLQFTNSDSTNAGTLFIQGDL